MKALKIGITHADKYGENIIQDAFEDILLDEICTKTLYDSLGQEAIEEALSDWEEGKTDAILVIPAEGESRLNPADLWGVDMIVWGDLRMAFHQEGVDEDEEWELLHMAMEREFGITKPRIALDLDTENWRAYDVVLAENREQCLQDFLQLSNGNGVAYTTGRDLICTSPFSKESFRESIYLAKDILISKEQYDSARTNPLPKLFQEKREDNRKR